MAGQAYTVFHVPSHAQDTIPCVLPQATARGEEQVLKKNSTWVPSSSGPPYEEEDTRESCGPAAAGQVSGIHSSNPELEL